MNTVEQLKEMLRDAHRTLEENVGDLTAEQAHWIPPGRLHPIDALFAHVVVGEDVFVSRFVRQVPALCETAWATKTGVGEPHPENPPWDEWAKRVQIDLPALREYARAVYARTEDYFDSLSPEDLDAPSPVSPPGVTWTMSYVLGPATVGHTLPARRRDLGGQGPAGSQGVLVLERQELEGET